MWHDSDKSVVGQSVGGRSGGLRRRQGGIAAGFMVALVRHHACMPLNPSVATRTRTETLLEDGLYPMHLTHCPHPWFSLWWRLCLPARWPSPAGRWWVAGAVAVSLGLPDQAAMAADCQIPQGPETAQPTATEQAPLPATAWEAHYQRLLQMEASCARSANYLAALGAAELNTGRLDRALIRLENALLEQPTHGGAQVDYARALFLSRQPFAALALNEQLRARRDLPAGLDDFLDARARRWQAQLSSWNHQLLVSSGYDNNINAAPDLDNATLTLPELEVELPLAATARATPSWTQAIRLESHYQQRLPEDGRRDLRLQSGYRVTQGPFNSWQAGVEWLESRVRGNQQLQLGAELDHLHYAGESLYQAAKVETRWQPRTSSNACVATLSGSLTLQHFPVDHRLDGLETRVTPGLVCRSGQASLGVRVGYIAQLADTPQRTGGDRHGFEAVLQAALPAGPGVISGQLETLQLDDQQGYSPLLGNNVKRQVSRYQAQLSYEVGLNERLSLSFNGMYREQHSSIALFRFDGSQFNAGLVWRF